MARENCARLQQRNDIQRENIELLTAKVADWERLAWVLSRGKRHDREMVYSDNNRWWRLFALDKQEPPWIWDLAMDSEGWPIWNDEARTVIDAARKATTSETPIL